MAQSKKRSPSQFLAVLRLVIAIIVLAGLLLAYRACELPWQPGGKSRQRFTVSMVKVVDGDTIRVVDGRGTEIKVRLVGIDAAELGTAQSFRAALFVAEQLEAAHRIELEPEPTDPTDKYGRSLSWVWVTDKDGNTTLLQEELVRHGLAELYRDAKGSKYYGRLELALRFQE